MEREPGHRTPIEQVAAASQGDAAAIEALLERYLPDLESYLARRAGRRVLRREAPEDLAQSVCREALERLRHGRFEFRGEPAFREWLYRAALMKLMNRNRHWNAERRAVELEAALPLVPGEASEAPGLDPAVSATPSRAAEWQEELERFELAYVELPERQREVLRLFHVEGLSHADIAGQLAISEANSRMLLSRALARIGRRLA